MRQTEWVREQHDNKHNYFSSVSSAMYCTTDTLHSNTVMGDMTNHVTKSNTKCIPLTDLHWPWSVYWPVPPQSSQLECALVPPQCCPHQVSAGTPLTVGGHSARHTHWSVEREQWRRTLQSINVLKILFAHLNLQTVYTCIMVHVLQSDGTVVYIENAAINTATFTLPPSHSPAIFCFLLSPALRPV